MSCEEKASAIKVPEISEQQLKLAIKKIEEAGFTVKDPYVKRIRASCVSFAATIPKCVGVLLVTVDLDGNKETPFNVVGLYADDNTLDIGKSSVFENAFDFSKTIQEIAYNTPTSQEAAFYRFGANDPIDLSAHRITPK